MEGIKYFWDNASNIGINKELDQDEGKRVKLLNQFGLVIITSSIPAIVYSTIIAKYYDVMVILFTVSLFSSITSCLLLSS